MRVIYDLPLPLGEPHYVICIDPKKINPIKSYPVGTDPTQMKISPLATAPGKERIVRKGKTVEVFGTLSSAGMKPLEVKANQGDEVLFHLTNIEQTEGKIIKFVVNGMDVLGVYPPGKTSTLRFVASQEGQYTYGSQDISSPYETQNEGQLIVNINPAFEAQRREANKLKADYVADLFMIPKVQAATSEKIHPGRAKFEEYGCVGCHTIGEEQTAPNLQNVTVRRTKDWIKKFVSNPENYYKDPTVAPLVKRFNLLMPNLEVKPADLDQIVEYLDTLKK